LHTLRYDFAQNTSATLRKTHTQRYDRIIVRGARRTSTGTFFYDEDQMEAVWNGTEESAYEAAASGVTGYSGWTTLVKQQRNAEVRSSAELSHVFSWFWLPDDWNLKVESPSDTTVSNVFIGDTPSELVKQYIHDVVFEPYVPLYEHVDYSGDIVGNGTAADPQVLVYRQPQVWFKVPTDSRYVAGDAIAAMAEGSGDPVGDGRNFRWSAYVRTQPDSRVLEVRVAGEQQHVIAETDFSPLAADRNLGDFDYHGKEMLVTATLRDNRYAEGAWPKDEGDGDDSNVDSRYGFIINAGDTFRQDYVVPNTVVDVATDGTLVTSNGGYVRDDTDILRGLARVAYEWWCIDRFILTLTTYQLTSWLQLGYMIMTIGHPDYGHWDDVGTVVSEIRVNWPILSPGQVASPTMRITTGSGELDPMTFAPREPEVLSRSRARTAR
jgi:hypothetical protein